MCTHANEALVFQGTEFVDRYQLQYQREDGAAWFTYQNRRRTEVSASCRKLTELSGSYRGGYGTLRAAIVNKSRK